MSLNLTIFVGASSSSSPVRALMNQQINDIISHISDISTMFRNPQLDLSTLRITAQSDFILGVVWASSINYFLVAFHNRYFRVPTDKEHEEANLVLFERGPEIREAIDKIMGL
jgi:hypothetical protein